MSLLVSVAVFGLLIFFHELGHFLAARRAGVKVHEFALGFGPRLLAFPRGDTTYAVRLFPMGGFVRMAGTEPGEEHDPQGFLRQSVAKRAMVIASGPLMNLLLAIMVFAALFGAVGITAPEPDSTVIGQALPGRPAQAAGLQAGDRITAVDGIPVADWPELVRLIRERPGQTVQLAIDRHGERLSIVVVPQDSPDRPGQGFIGVAPVTGVRRLPFLQAVVAAVTYTGQLILLVLQAIGGMLLGRVPVDLVGPVGTVAFIGQATRAGLEHLLRLGGFLSVNIGLFNLLPIPALDGSRLIFLGIEGLRGRPIDPARENLVHFVGFALLILLIIVVTYRDLLRLDTL
ncbi:MAG TPA: RIP metalloprotease RseP [Clostridiales bacterium]|nr:RIP metalloprotease RseP [Clostridiales bacterium]